MLAAWSPVAGTAPTKVFLSYHDVNADNLPYECISLNGGTVWQPVCNPMVTDPIVLANATGNTIVGPQAFDSAGTVYAAFTSPAAGDPNANFRNLYLAKPADGVVFATWVGSSPCSPSTAPTTSTSSGPSAPHRSVRARSSSRIPRITAITGALRSPSRRPAA